MEINRTHNNTAVFVTNLEKRFGNFIAVNKINLEVFSGENIWFFGA